MSSKVVSFRLDEDTTEEQQALNILEAWQKKGYSTREIMTWALMSLAGFEVTTPDNRPEEVEDSKSTIHELRQVLSQAQEFLESLRDMKAMPDQVQVPSQPRPVLTDHFLASVRKAVRPGLQLNDDEAAPN